MEILAYSQHIPKESPLTRNCFLYGLDSTKNTYLRVGAIFTATTLSFSNAVYYGIKQPLLFLCGKNVSENLEKMQASVLFISILFRSIISDLDTSHPTNRIMKIAQKHLSKSQNLSLAKAIIVSPKSKTLINLATALEDLSTTDQAVNLLAALASFSRDKAVNLFTAREDLPTDEAINVFTAIGNLPKYQIVNLFTAIENLKADEAINLFINIGNLPTYKIVNLFLDIGNRPTHEIVNLFTAIENLCQAVNLALLLKNLSMDYWAVNLFKALASFPKEHGFPLAKIMATLKTKQQVLNLFIALGNLPTEEAIIFITSLENLSTKKALTLVTPLVNLPEEKAIKLVRAFGLSLVRCFPYNGKSLVHHLAEKLITLPIKQRLILVTRIASFSTKGLVSHNDLASNIISIFGKLSPKQTFCLIRIFSRLSEKQADFLTSTLARMRENDALNLVAILVYSSKKDAYSLATTLAANHEANLQGWDAPAWSAMPTWTRNPTLAATIATVSKDAPYTLALALIKIFTTLSGKEGLHLATVFEELPQRSSPLQPKIAATLLAETLTKLPPDLVSPLVKTLTNLPIKESLRFALIVVKASEEEVCRLVQICENSPMDKAFRLA